MMDEINYADYFDKPLPNEDAKQFGRYLSYRNMNPVDRSMRAVTEILNNNGDEVQPKTVHNTGHKYKWAERAKAYDSHLSSIELQVIETGLAQAIDYTLEMEDVEIVMMTQIAHKMLRKASKAIDIIPAEGEKGFDTIDAQRLFNMTELLQKVRRRRAGLATNYITERADEPNLEDTRFIIGGE